MNLRNILIGPILLLALLEALVTSIPSKAHDATSAARPALRSPSPAVVNPPVRNKEQHVLSLDGEWTFCTDPNKAGEAGKWFEPKANWPNSRTLVVPGCWEAQGVGTPGEHNLLSPINRNISYVPSGMKTEYEGIGWYRKELSVPAAWVGQQVWLKFGGVNAVGRAYVNATPVADLGGPGKYCGTYKYNVTDLLKPGEPAVIVVMVRNDVPSSKGSRNLARRYGGIDGSVELEATPALLIDYADVLADAARQTATVNLALRHAGAKPEDPAHVEVNVVVRDAGGRIVGQKDEIKFEWTGETGAGQVDIPLSPCALWSPEHPVLHTAEITLLQDGKVIHGWTERFGIANWTTQGSDILLNGRKFFARGIGFDSHWPLNISYPLDHETLRQFMRLIRSYGFNYIRHWAHTPPPEFCEAAAEEGICLTVELPYYHTLPHNRQGRHQNERMPAEYDIPATDLNELIAQYRRHPSICTFSGGNEGTLNADLPSLLKTVHEKAPGKLWTVNTGHTYNRPGVADYKADYFSRINNGKFAPSIPNFPHILHEYSNPSYAHDPRIAGKYTTGYLPPIPLEIYKKQVAETGLSWPWVNAVLDASLEMLFYYQKLAIENARVWNDPPLSGYHLWGSINGDSHFYARQNGGLFDAFLGQQKGGSPEYFQQFNMPVVLLCKITPQGAPFLTSLTNGHGSGAKGPKVEAYPEQLVFTSGNVIDLDFQVSNYGEAALKGTLDWSISDGRKTLLEKSVDCRVEQGSVVSVNKVSWTVPELTEAVRLTVTARLRGTNTRNSWDIWVFPKPEAYSRSLSGVAASSEDFTKLKDRYPGLIEYKPGAPMGDDFNLLITSSIDHAKDACDKGKRVVLLSFRGFTLQSPKAEGGEWNPTPQQGTAIDHVFPVFRHFPIKSYLEPVFKRLINTALPMSPALQNVRPFMVGAGVLPGRKGETRQGFLLYAYETASGKGRLLATGLNLLSEAPEAAALLDGFIAYAQSDAFNPKGSFDFNAVKQVQNTACGKVRQSAETQTVNGFRGEQNMHITKTGQPEKPLVWETPNAPGAFPPSQPAWDVACFVAMGAEDQRPVEFTFSVNGKATATITLSFTNTVWEGADGVRLSYDVKENETHVVQSTIFADMEKAMQTDAKNAPWKSSGILRLSIPVSLLTPKQPVTLKIESNSSVGRGWFGLMTPKPLER